MAASDQKLDGFRLTLTDRKTGVARQLDRMAASSPTHATTQFLYSIPQQRLSLRRTQFVPDGITCSLRGIRDRDHGNRGQGVCGSTRSDVNLMPVWLGDEPA